MPSDPLLRAAVRAHRLGPEACCAVCGRTNMLVTKQTPTGQVVLCQDHDRQRRGVSRHDIGHIARRRSFGSLTYLTPTSANQRIEDMRRDLGLADTPTPHGDPLLILADYMEGRALLDLLYAGFWREFDAFLRTRYGDRYWEGGPEAPIV